MTDALTAMRDALERMTEAERAELLAALGVGRRREKKSEPRETPKATPLRSAGRALNIRSEIEWV